MQLGGDSMAMVLNNSPERARQAFRRPPMQQQHRYQSQQQQQQQQQLQLQQQHQRQQTYHDQDTPTSHIQQLQEENEMLRAKLNEYQQKFGYI
jgi:predicted RNase H-like nuclease (RuvC/YqgF family)